MQHILLIVAVLFSFISLPAFAQFGDADKGIMVYAQNIARNCPGRWESQPCLEAVSESALVLTANYAEILQGRGKGGSLETLKQHCAAATAATKGEYPAYAMRSAYTECANIMSDLTAQTGIAPDASHYQLLVFPILCLDGEAQCPAFEAQLSQYK